MLIPLRELDPDKTNGIRCEAVRHGHPWLLTLGRAGSRQKSAAFVRENEPRILFYVRTLYVRCTALVRLYAYDTRLPN